MNYSRFISKQSSRRKPSCISELRRALENGSPSLVWLASGMPSPEKFPFREMTVTLEGGKQLTLSKEALSTGLQYGPSQGYPLLRKQLKRMVEQWHSPPRWAESDLLVTVGNQDGVSKALDMLLDPEDFIVVPDPCYSDFLCMLTALAPQIVAVGVDDEGIRPDILKSSLEKAISSGSTGIPKALYLVPNSCNPTGTNMSEERRQEIYAIAQQYDLIILEDDPYFFLQFNEKQLTSFLSMDVDGRVLRFDSFSKVISSGLRIGCVTGAPPLLQGITLHMQASCICPPMLSQVLIHELLTFWGDEGFKKHISDICQFYKDRRDAMIQALETHLNGICEWIVPEGGIFVWLKVLHLNDTSAMLLERAAKGDVVLVPGREFMVDSTKPCPYMRAAYSCATPEEMMKGMENLAKLIQKEIELQSTHK
ncbi:kynurenine/alpha-aminoadipate aminotransferase, mitochondrial-like isoform X2 [Portunus trituberculatus]|nr:kynurenine/alpha-aminoadipate aminotransferase, mitochondrial-like isoform X2 [Portunus trituberculatus]XP_045127575.1 kynurenine/alpha-aminoadipate aminotransferase, mitochondrial-like isoform X2 [Portunus trituberculatus]XP_045127576.1 kynurenine/alpha-aminoadipate aminotransferase, mitochondrial-like isoform X2 [Portunus trituberculatus]XP_045127577.1 kynurenine/alpha-aminoadipate aminotransferase, mitochondrial-like isoform X2 [Portunus trituberculatus]XP_045127578.1 kynurenine/alpha-ami